MNPLEQEISDLKNVIASLQADNRRLERELRVWINKANPLICPNCHAPGWDEVTGCEQCSIDPADLT